jgi:hypothetical protein
MSEKWYNEREKKDDYCSIICNSIQKINAITINCQNFSLFHNLNPIHNNFYNTQYKNPKNFPGLTKFTAPISFSFLFISKAFIKDC